MINVKNETKLLVDDIENNMKVKISNNIEKKTFEKRENP